MSMALGMALCGHAASEHTLTLETGVTANASSGDFAPYFLGANNHGTLTQAQGTQLFVKAHHDMDTTRRFSYGYGAAAYGGWQSSTDYLRYYSAANDFSANTQHPSRVWLQELYGQIKYRGVELTVGLKERESYLFNSRLGSGDFIESGNARPVPQARIGFIDFQNIPFTNGWVQIQGNVAYGIFTDNAWWENHFDYYNGHIARNTRYMYRRIYFRTKPSQPLSVTVGAQSAAQFGGSTSLYYTGKLWNTYHRSGGIKECIKIFFPFGQNDEDYYIGNTIGSWDLSARYRFNNGDELKAYFQWPWEDGSGVGKLNGFDGIWGLEYTPKGLNWLKGVVVEYIDFMNQSGPIHWAPGDFPGTSLVSQATGSDDYYNNKTYNSYANYGLVLGTPVIMSPIYNTDGQILCLNNRMRGFHIGAEGSISPKVDYRVLLNYRKSYGNSFYYLADPIHQTSAMGERTWRPSVKGLKVTGALAIDRGKLPSNSFGGMVTVSYTGNFNLKRHE